MERKKGRGGARPGSGRKPAEVKKMAVFAYVSETAVEAVGGKEAAKDIAEQAIIRRAKKC